MSSSVGLLLLPDFFPSHLLLSNAASVFNSSHHMSFYLHRSKGKLSSFVSHPYPNQIPTKEVLMMAQSKIMALLACGIALGLGLSHHPTWAEDGMKAPQSEARVGGQAGQPYEQALYKDESAQTKERLHRQHGARIGGQAGQPYDHLKHDYESTHAKGRVGGEAGESYSPIQLE